MLKKIFAALLAAVALVGFGSNALAADQTIVMQDDNPGLSWIATLSVGGVDTFTGSGGYDTLTFVMPGAPIGTYSVSFAVVGNFMTNLSDGTLTAGQVSQALAVQNIGPAFAVAQGGLQNVFIEDGQFRVTYTGPYSDGLDVYVAGELISAVPEPRTSALMLAGLLGIGFLAKRSVPR